MARMTASSFADVLRFWLGAYPLDADAMRGAQRQWFQKDDAFDARLREGFGATIAQARAGRLGHWADSADGWLALILVLDQFTRNAFRGQPDSFAGDAQALQLAVTAVGEGWDRPLLAVEKVFVYLPFEHSEALADQERSLTLFAALAAEHPGCDGFLDYACRHHEVIARFGRFPHRNAALGRPSTPEEASYLAEPGSGF